jgi:hypothetical protein
MAGTPSKVPGNVDPYDADEVELTYGDDGMKRLTRDSNPRSRMYGGDDADFDFLAARLNRTVLRKFNYSNYNYDMKDSVYANHMVPDVRAVPYD